MLGLNRFHRLSAGRVYLYSWKLVRAILFFAATRIFICWSNNLKRLHLTEQWVADGFRRGFFVVFLPHSLTLCHVCLWLFGCCHLGRKIPGCYQHQSPCKTVVNLPFVHVTSVLSIGVVRLRSHRFHGFSWNTKECCSCTGQFAPSKA